MNLSEEEKVLLEQYQVLSDSIPSLLNRLLIEIVPPIIFVGIGLYTGKVIWFLVLISLMVFYSVQRIIRQYKNIVELKSISKKTIGNVNEQSKT